MNPRERYLEAILFGKPDKVPLSPGGPRESTRAAWYKQGLPEGANYMSALHDILGIQPDKTKPGVSVGVSFKMMPEVELVDVGELILGMSSIHSSLVKI